MKDMHGKEITIGARIVWPGRYSSDLWLNSGLVTGISRRQLNSFEPYVPSLEIARDMKSGELLLVDADQTFTTKIERVAVVE